MARILRRDPAIEDLVDIFTAAASRSQSLLERRRAAIERTLHLLAENPGLGSRRLPDRPDVRVFPVEAYMIFYRPLAAGDGIDLLRIRPASSDWLGSLDLPTP
jgi:plasmid stabilization system protein ParE